MLTLPSSLYQRQRIVLNKFIPPSYQTENIEVKQLEPLKRIAAINQVPLHRLTSPSPPLPPLLQSFPLPPFFHLRIPPHPPFLSPSHFISISRLSELTLIDEGCCALIVFDEMAGRPSCSLAPLRFILEPGALVPFRRETRGRLFLLPCVAHIWSSLSLSTGCVLTARAVRGKYTAIGLV